MLWLVWLAVEHLHVDERRRGGVGDDLAHDLAHADRAGADRLVDAGVPAGTAERRARRHRRPAPLLHRHAVLGRGQRRGPLRWCPLSGILTAPVLLALVFTNGIGLAMRWPVYAAIVPGAGAAHAAARGARAERRGDEPLARRGPAGGRRHHRVGRAASTSSRSTSCSRSSPASCCAAGSARASPRCCRASASSARCAWAGSTCANRSACETRSCAPPVFFLHSTALLALLPLVAKRLPAAGRGDYTMPARPRWASGAIVAATQLPRMRVRWTRDQLAVGGSVVPGGAAAAVVAVSPNTWLAAPAMFVAGMAWIIGRQLGDRRRAARAARLGARARHVDLPDGDHGRHARSARSSGDGSPSAPRVPMSLALRGREHARRARAHARTARSRAEAEDHTPTHPWAGAGARARASSLDDGPVHGDHRVLHRPGARAPNSTR